MEHHQDMHLVNLSIAGEWTARDFTRVFGLLDEVNSMFTVLYLARATVVNAVSGRAAYLRRVSRKDDPQVSVEGVQFGSPGDIQAGFSWSGVVDFLLRRFLPASKIDSALKDEQLKQARAQTEAAELDNQRRRVALRREELALEAESLEVAEAKEQAALEDLLECFGSSDLLGLITQLRQKIGAPYTVIAEYLIPRVETVDALLSDFRERGLLTGITLAQTRLPGPEGHVPPADGCM